MSEGRVTLHIDCLVLRGIDPLDQRALVGGLKAELARVLAEPATRAAMGNSAKHTRTAIGQNADAAGIGGSANFG